MPKDFISVSDDFEVMESSKPINEQLKKHQVSTDFFHTTSQFSNTLAASVESSTEPHQTIVCAEGKSNELKTVSRKN